MKLQLDGHVRHVHLGVKRELTEARIARRQKTYSCEICPPGATLWKSNCRYKDHMILYHSDTKQTYPCEDCGKVFALKSRWYSHYKTMHKEKQLDLHCDQCGKPAMNRSALNRHIRSVHEGLVYKCTLCDTTFVDKMREKIFRHYGSNHSIKQGKYLENAFNSMKLQRV